MKLEPKDIKPGMKFKMSPERINDFRLSPEWGIKPGQVYVVSKVVGNVVHHNHYGVFKGECSSWAEHCDFIQKKTILINGSK